MGRGGAGGVAKAGGENGVAETFCCVAYVCFCWFFVCFPSFFAAYVGMIRKTSHIRYGLCRYEQNHCYYFYFPAPTIFIVQFLFIYHFC